MAIFAKQTFSSDFSIYSEVVIGWCLLKFDLQFSQVIAKAIKGQCWS